MFNLNRVQSVALTVTLIVAGVMISLFANQRVERATLALILFAPLTYLWIVTLANMLHHFLQMQYPVSRVVDAVDAYPPMTPRITPAVNRLHEMGFRRLGEVTQPSGFGEQEVIRVLAHADEPVFAEVWESGQVDLHTPFSNRMLVQTGCPSGDMVRDEDYWRSYVTADLHTALEVHRVLVAQFRRPERTPVYLRTMEILLRWYEIDRPRYLRRRQMKPLFIALSGLAWLTLVLVILGVRIAAQVEQSRLSDGLGLATDALLWGGTVIFLAVWWLLSPRRPVWL